MACVLEKKKKKTSNDKMTLDFFNPDSSLR